MTIKTNEHITEYLNWYISDECKNPRFAVLVKGGWGSGKTWFIKKFIKDNDDRLNELANNKTSKSNFIYLSLYGLSTINDIDDQIFKELHPILSDKKFGIAGNLGKKLFDQFIMKLPDCNIPDILPDFLKDFGSKILVFDDLERCNIPADKVFGYVNSFVEHQSKRVIIIANDEEIESALPDEEKKASSKYHQIKEKVIGKTFKIQTDIPVVINALLEENAQSSKAALLKRGDLLITIFETVMEKTEKKYTNYRAFAHAIRDFEYLWKKLDQKYKEHEELITEFLNEFMRLAYEVQLGLITGQDISNIEAAQIARVMDSINNKKEQQENKYEAIEAFIARHRFDTYNMLLHYKLWAKILSETVIDLNEMHESFNNSKYFRSETRADWVSLWHFRDLEDDAAKEVIESIARKLIAHDYKEIGVVFHIYGCLLRRNEDGIKLPMIIGNTPEEIENHAKKYIDHLSEFDVLPRRVDIAKKFISSSYHSLGFASLESKYFGNIRSYFLKKCREKQCKLSSEEIDELLNYMITDSREFYGRISTPNNHNDVPSYWNVPIFQNIAPDRFLKVYKEMPNDQKELIDDAFNERYRVINNPNLQLEAAYHEFLGELAFMKKLYELVENAITEAPIFTPTVWHLKHLKENGLKFAIEELEKFAESKKTVASDEL